MFARAAGTTALVVALSTLASVASAAPPPGATRAVPGRAETVRHVAETGSVTASESEDDAGTCTRARRRLWVEGEGWVVRRITTCR